MCRRQDVQSVGILVLRPFASRRGKCQCPSSVAKVRPRVSGSDRRQPQQGRKELGILLQGLLVVPYSLLRLIILQQQIGVPAICRGILRVDPK